MESVPVHAFPNVESDLVNNLLNSLSTDKYADVTFIIPKTFEGTNTNPSLSDHDGMEDGLDQDELGIDENDSNLAEYPCIRALFAMNSPVFDAMLFGNMKESESKVKIHLSDIDSNTFEFLQQFFYRLNPQITQKNVIGILYASNKYLIKHLKYACIKFIVSNIIEVNVRQSNMKDLVLFFYKLYCYGLTDLIIQEFLPLIKINCIGQWNQIFESMLTFEDKYNLDLGLKFIDILLFHSKSPFVIFMNEYCRKAHSKFSLHRKFTIDECYSMYQKLWHFVIKQCIVSVNGGDGDKHKTVTVSMRKEDLKMNEESNCDKEWMNVLKYQFLDYFAVYQIGIVFYIKNILPLGIVDESSIFTFESDCEKYFVKNLYKLSNEVTSNQIIQLIEITNKYKIDIDIIKKCLIAHINANTWIEIESFWSNKSIKTKILRFPRKLFEILLFDSNASAVALANRKVSKFNYNMWNICVEWCKHNWKNNSNNNNNSNQNFDDDEKHNSNINGWESMMRDNFSDYFKPSQMGCQFFVKNIARVMGVRGDSNDSSNNSYQSEQLRKCCIKYSSDVLGTQILNDQQSVDSMMELVYHLCDIGFEDIVQEYFIPNICVESQEIVDLIKGHQMFDKLPNKLQKALLDTVNVTSNDIKTT